MGHKYFHELTDKEFEEAVNNHLTYGDFKQPKWCSYPNALDWNMGCWSLTERTIKTKNDCKNCECCIKNK